MKRRSLFVFNGVEFSDSGFTLTEVLVAAITFAIVIAITTSIYLVIMNIYQNATTQAQAQNYAQNAVVDVSTYLREAAPCPGQSSPILSASSTSLQFSAPFYEAGGPTVTEGTYTVAGIVVFNLSYNSTSQVLSASTSACPKQPTISSETPVNVPYVTSFSLSYCDTKSSPGANNTCNFQSSVSSSDLGSINGVQISVTTKYQNFPNVPPQSVTDEVFLYNY